MKYAYIDDAHIVQEIIHAFTDAFPGVPAAQRYSPDFLSHCLELPEDTAVEPGMEYLPQENRFVPALRYTGAAGLAIDPGQDAVIPVSFSEPGGWRVTKNAGLPVAATDTEIRIEAVPEGVYTLAVRFTSADGRTLDQAIRLDVFPPAPDESPPSPAPPTELQQLGQQITDEQLARIELGQENTDLELAMLGGTANV